MLPTPSNMRPVVCSPGAPFQVTKGEVKVRVFHWLAVGMPHLRRAYPCPRARPPHWPSIRQKQVLEPGHVHGCDEWVQPVREVRGLLCSGGLGPRHRPWNPHVSTHCKHPPRRPLFFRSPTCPGCDVAPCNQSSRTRMCSTPQVRRHARIRQGRLLRVKATSQPRRHRLTMRLRRSAPAAARHGSSTIAFEAKLKAGETRRGEG